MLLFLEEWRKSGRKTHPGSETSPQEATQPLKAKRRPWPGGDMTAREPRSGDFSRKENPLHVHLSPQIKTSTQQTTTLNPAESFKLHRRTHAGFRSFYLRNEAILQIPPALGPPRATLGGHPSPPRHSRRRSPAFSIQEPALLQTPGCGAGAGSGERRQWGSPGCSAGSRGWRGRSEKDEADSNPQSAPRLTPLSGRAATNASRAKLRGGGKAQTAAKSSGKVAGQRLLGSRSIASG